MIHLGFYLRAATLAATVIGLGSCCSSLARAQDINTGGDTILPARIRRPANPVARRRRPPVRPPIRQPVHPGRPPVASASAIRQPPPTVDVSEQVDDAIERGNTARDAGRFAEAEEAYREALRLDRGEARAYTGIGNVYFDQRRYAEAIEASQQATRLDPNSAVAYNTLGNAYLNLRRYAEAIQAYQQAIRLDPNDALAHTNLGNASFGLGRHAEALAAYQQAIRLDPNEVENYWWRAWTYLHLNQGGLASQDASTYLELVGANDVRAQYMVLVGYFGKRQADDANAGAILESWGRRVDASQWPYPAIRYLRREITAQQLLALATDNDKMTEARAYLGMELSLSGRRNAAIEHLRWVSEYGNRNFIEYALALTEIRRIEARRP